MACVPYYRDNAFGCGSYTGRLLEPVPMSFVAQFHLDYICSDQVDGFGKKYFDLAHNENSIPAWSEFQHRNLIYQAISLHIILSLTREIAKQCM